jgi:hypothetical protein
MIEHLPDGHVIDVTNYTRKNKNHLHMVLSEITEKMNALENDKTAIELFLNI